MKSVCYFYYLDSCQLFHFQCARVKEDDGLLFKSVKLLPAHLGIYSHYFYELGC